MANKEYKVGVYEEDGVEYGVANELDLLRGIKNIKFAGTNRFYVSDGEELAVEDQESYSVSNTMFCNGTIYLDGVLGVN